MAFPLTTLNCWSTPLGFSRTPGGTRTLGWEPQLYKISMATFY